MTKVTKEMTTCRLPGRGRQWRASANRAQQVQVLRVAILLSYCSILCNYKAIEMPSHQTYGGSWKFLTFIDLVIQAVFFGICVLTDLSSLLTRGSGNQEQERQLRKLISLRDWMLAVLAFPVGVFVVAVFWIIYAYDREMIYPKLLDNFIPGWLNHGMHTTVLPFILIEMRTSHHQYPSRSSGLTAICTFSVGYILWVCWVHHVTGMWVYPFLEHIGPGARIIFFGSTTILMNFLYLLGEVLNNYIWDTQRRVLQTNQPQVKVTFWTFHTTMSSTLMLPARTNPVQVIKKNFFPQINLLLLIISHINTHKIWLTNSSRCSSNLFKISLPFCSTFLEIS
uniref:Androgen induced 1 n=2 Tax=Papio anubis TaxID=9555 RepID=A0A8I5R075_PAPAN